MKPGRDDDDDACGDSGLGYVVFTSRMVPSSGKGKRFASALSFYIGVVYTVGTFIRLIFKDSSKRMIYEEVPTTDLLLDLCNGIYTARLQGNMEVEFKLYYELIRVYRSPELLAYVSKPVCMSYPSRNGLTAMQQDSDCKEHPEALSRG